MLLAHGVNPEKLVLGQRLPELKPGRVAASASIARALQHAWYGFRGNGIKLAS